MSSRAQGHEKDPLGERCYAMPAAQFCQGEPLGKSDAIFSMRQTRESLLRGVLRVYNPILSSNMVALSLCGFYSSDSVEQWAPRQRVLVDGGYGEDQKEKLCDLQPEASMKKSWKINDQLTVDDMTP